MIPCFRVSCSNYTLLPNTLLLVTRPPYLGSAHAKSNAEGTSPEYRAGKDTGSKLGIGRYWVVVLGEGVGSGRV